MSLFFERILSFCRKVEILISRLLRQATLLYDLCFVTNAVKPNYSLVSCIFSASQEIAGLYRTRSFIAVCLLLVRILYQTNLSTQLYSIYLKYILILYLRMHPGLRSFSFLQQFSSKPCLHSLMSRKFYMPHPSHSHKFRNTNDVW